MENKKITLTSQMVEAEGIRLHKISLVLMCIGIVGLGILLLGLMAWLGDLDGIGLIVIFVIGGLGVAIGLAAIPMYFSSLQLFALGRIAVNTEKSANTVAVPQAPIAPGAPAPRYAPPAGYQLPRL